jgi:uncharacterized protein YecT (DUF1311 family)
MCNTIFRSFAFTLFLTVSSAASAQTQIEMTTDACVEYKQADAGLNSVYRQVLAKHEDDQRFIAKFKEAQRAWLKFRDAHLESVFSAQDKQGEYGSSFSMCRCSEVVILTNQRIAQMKQWLADNEGDVCAGSRS